MTDEELMKLTSASPWEPVINTDSQINCLRIKIHDLEQDVIKQNNSIFSLKISVVMCQIAIIYLVWRG